MTWMARLAPDTPQCTARHILLCCIPPYRPTAASAIRMPPVTASTARNGNHAVSHGPAPLAARRRALRRQRTEARAVDRAAVRDGDFLVAGHQQAHDHQRDAAQLRLTAGRGAAGPRQSSERAVCHTSPRRRPRRRTPYMPLATMRPDFVFCLLHMAPAGASDAELLTARDARAAGPSRANAGGSEGGRRGGEAQVPLRLSAYPYSCSCGVPPPADASASARDSASTAA